MKWTGKENRLLSDAAFFMRGIDDSARGFF
jgi:hypothetical protein